MTAQAILNSEKSVAKDLCKELLIPADEAIELTKKFLVEIQNSYNDNLKIGSMKTFSSKTQDFMALDTCVQHTPDGREKGVYYGIDLGGSNLRVIRCKLNGDGTTELYAVKEDARNFECGFPNGLLDPKATATMLFDFIAERVHECAARCGDLDKFIAIGFCFSFALKQIMLDRAICVGMSKGWDTGVETNDSIVGADVCTMLNKALRRAKVQGRVVGCINDTTGTCLTAAYEKDPNLPATHLGVIVGTGFNICILDDKALHHGYAGSIVNLEAGGFKQHRRTIIDLDIDLASSNKGNQRCEKAVGGLFLGELCRYSIIRVFRSRAPVKAWKYDALQTADCMSVFNMKEPADRLHCTTKLMAETFDWNITEADAKIISNLFIAIIERSARLAAICIAACAIKTDRLRGVFGGVTAGIDGSVFCKNPRFQESVQTCIDEILGNRSSMLHIVVADDGSGKGAAMMASAVQLKPNDVYVPGLYN